VSKTLLLIGARGFAGSHLLDMAREAGLRVLAASREGTSDALPCDLLDLASVEACVEVAQPDLVVNAAGSPSVAASWERPDEALAVNARGVLNLLKAISDRAPGAHLVCISSAAVYAEPGAEQKPLTERDRLAPVSPYGVSKAEMEVACARYVRELEMRIAIVRAFNLIGPGQPPFHSASGFARRIAEAEWAGDSAVELKLGNPGAARDFTDVRDAARGIVELSRRECWGTFNLCSRRKTTIAELVAELARQTRLQVNARRDPGLARPVDPTLLVGDPSRLREATGFEPAIPLSQSLADLLGWWRRRLAGA